MAVHKRYPGWSIPQTTSWFIDESQIKQPMLTPLLGDAAEYILYPKETDFPAYNLINGTSAAGTLGNGSMSLLTLPRHGSRPAPVPMGWPAISPLPGAINVSFFDGHGEQVKLDKLWQLYWHLGYQPPLKRTGLP
jgi:prepilin-type processing-associated H-X9-DG protein